MFERIIFLQNGRSECNIILLFLVNNLYCGLFYDPWLNMLEYALKIYRMCFYYTNSTRYLHVICTPQIRLAD